MARSISALRPLYNIFPYWNLLLILLILSGGLPIFLATSWKALKARKYHALLFLLLSLICPPIIVFQDSSLSMRIDYSPWWNVSLLFLIAALSLTFIRMAVQNIPPSRRVTYSALYLATPLPLVMLIFCAFILFSALPAFTTGEITSFMMGNHSLPGDGFIWDSFFVDCLMLLIMGATCSFSLFSLLKGFQAKKVTQDTL